jgi:hypothetical protein
MKITAMAVLNPTRPHTSSHPLRHSRGSQQGFIKAISSFQRSTNFPFRTFICATLLENEK